MEESKTKCDICEKEKDASYSENLKEYLCEDCWDEYGKLCHLGLA